MKELLLQNHVGDPHPITCRSFSTTLTQHSAQYDSLFSFVGYEVEHTAADPLVPTT